ncbi:MAG: phosphoribosylformylglycinamidine synthase subunit PurL [Planctomycetota bacterium]|nr:MAG: phosphoribosylformylglycinamidine synthase subunit PurL [Planctomycetota bacterium]REJ96690.1 MAG: phosphoribosylformylglycinamidine synthase subunit PurL [Planctomycetota bacterium]REK22291.1 MAG: phosphoribosylformylglycinamidine synthase subunit PurL [Planctomycetota bacterium]REK41080.1 MAG: phosphoribosylformylglycinamidine synthase subunit PurL [Planctomycetota bacterium]
MLWEVDIYPRAGQTDRTSGDLRGEAADMGWPDLNVTAAHGYLLEGRLTPDDAERVARALLADNVVEQTVVAPLGDARLAAPPKEAAAETAGEGATLLHVMPKPGVMDPVAQSALAAIADLEVPVTAVRTMRKMWIAGLADADLDKLAAKVLSNDAIEQVIRGPLDLERLEVGTPYAFELVHVPIRELDTDALNRLSHEAQLYLQPAEMQAIAAYYRELGRDPTDVELETLAQTWSEHCSHKTLAGRIAYEGPLGAGDSPRDERQFENMLKETIFAATQAIRQQLGDDDWCVSVFEDNAGIVRFDEEDNVVFKVETHNHPSAIEPYGGANTGIGGVIRDPLGTGLGAKPIANTDVFCFALPDVAADRLPPGVLHPRRVMKGVVAGVRDYGNRMGIPTVNGAVYFDERYLGNPLVYCGNVGILPRDKSHKEPQPGDLIVAVGGRTGRDGIHGATFSSVELTHESESISGSAVQIGNAITEKMVLDVVLAARDQGLYSAITDCGAGGFSSAVGEMGEKIGAEVWLERAPVKYAGLSYTEIWISEAQERMVLSVPPEKWEALSQLAASEGVEATVIGKFVPTGRLQLKYNDHEVADLAMKFLHDGRPPVVRQAIYTPPSEGQLADRQGTPAAVDGDDAGEILLDILGSPNVASKHWIIRQYDHEVQGGSVIKPLVGVANDGPSDAAVVRPKLVSRRGLVIACGMNPRYAAFDTYHMAASAIDEALRNCVAVGANPSRIAILDNFCWGDCERSETLGALVRAALACYDVATGMTTPFISGKDSLNNEFSYVDEDGRKRTIAIPSTLLISALGQVADVKRCVTMDLKQSGSLLYQVGTTHQELGGSHLALVRDLDGGSVPKVDVPLAKQILAAVHRAIDGGLVRACHDLSEGGLAVALAEMAFAGNLGTTVDLAQVPRSANAADATSLLFSESNTRFVCEVEEQHAAAFEAALADVPHGRIGKVDGGDRLKIAHDGETLLDIDLATLKRRWQAPFDW